jgi:3-deoxy-D-manno-octulosonate 8-phosphate phosphatase (KDO 8-P phosphatase)
MMTNMVLVLDVDGTLTDGKMYYTENGKYIKVFGPDDHDALKEASKFMKIQFISADKKGFSISKRRIFDEMNFPLALVSEKAKERWEWIKKTYPKEEIVFVGDGINDYECLRNAKYSACPVDSLDHIKDSSDYVSARRGGDRFVADVIIELSRAFDLKMFMEE